MDHPPPPPPEDHPQHRCLFGCGPGQIFSSDYELKDHIYSKHWPKNVDAVKCMNCNYIGKTKATLKSHSLTHYNVFPYQCTLCPGKFKWATTLRLHYAKVHPESEKGKKAQRRGRPSRYGNSGNVVESPNGAGSRPESPEGRASPSPMNQQNGVHDEESRSEIPVERASRMDQENGVQDEESRPEILMGRASPMNQQNGVQDEESRPEILMGRASPMNQQNGVQDEESRPEILMGRASPMNQQNGVQDEESRPEIPMEQASLMDQQNDVEGSDADPELETSNGLPTSIGPFDLARQCHCQLRFRCLKRGCYSFFRNELEYRSHILSHVPPTWRGSYACIDCPKEFNTYPQVQEHLKQHYVREPVTCSSCQFSTCNKEVLRAHKASEHKELWSKTIIFFHQPGSSNPKGNVW